MWKVAADQPTETEILLAQALTGYQQSLCPGCGDPKHTAWNPDAAGCYQVDCDIECAGCAALKNERRKATARTGSSTRRASRCD